MRHDSKTGASEPFGYRCPHCGEEYADEILARVHVTRSSDNDHKNCHGFMPETTIEVVDSDGTLNEKLSGGDELNPNSLALSAFPEDFGSRKIRVLQVAALRPSAGYSDVHEGATNVLDEHDLEPVSYGTVRRWVRGFYTPQLEEADKSETPAESGDMHESLGDLTAKQQAVVIAHLDDPEASSRDLADRAGCSVAYPTSVLERAESIVDRLSERIEAEQPLERVVVDELSEQQRERLAEDDLLGPEFFDDRGVGDATSPGARGNSEADGSMTGRRARIMSAAPDQSGPVGGLLADGATVEVESADEKMGRAAGAAAQQNDTSGELPLDPGAYTTEEQGTGSSQEPSQQGEATATGDAGFTDSSDSPVAGASAEAKTDEAIPRDEIEALRDQVRFMRRVVELETAERPNGERTHAQFALVREFETALEQLLDG